MLRLEHNDSILSTVEEWSIECYDEHLTPRTIASRLRTAFLGFGVHPKITVEYYDFGDKDYYSIGGEYFYCEKYDFGLRLIFDERTKGSKIHCNAKWINCVRTEMLEVAVHEYQHHFQDRSRPDASVYYQNTLHDDRSTQTVYLSNADEIDAYGVSIAYGIFDRYAEGALNMDFKQAAMSVPDFDDYIKTFRGQWQHPVIKQLVKKIAKNLTEIIEYYD